MSKGIVMTSFLITQSEASVPISAFSMDHEMGSLISLLTLYKSSIEQNIDRMVIPFYPLSSFLLLNATANDMPANMRDQRF